MVVTSLDHRSISSFDGRAPFAARALARAICVAADVCCSLPLRLDPRRLLVVVVLLTLDMVTYLSERWVFDSALPVLVAPAKPLL